MRLIARTIESNADIDLISDSHDGSNGCYHEGLAEYVAGLAGTSAIARYFAHLGDAADAVCSDDKRYSYRPNQALPLQQCENVVATFEPAAPKGLAWLLGNHEYKLHRFGNISRDLMAEPLGIPYGGYMCKLSLADKYGPICKFFLWHGPIRGSVTSNAKDHHQRQANMQAAVRRYMENKAADCAVMAMGHCFDEETELYTETGWKRHSDLEPGVRVLTLNRETGYLEYNSVEQVHRYEGYDQLISFEGKSCSLAVTPEHGLWTCSGTSGSGLKNPYKEEKASDAEGKTRTMRCSGELDPKTPGLPLTDPQISFLAWLMAEGYITTTAAKEGGSCYSIRIAQSDAPDGRLRVLLECCDACGLDYLLSRKYTAGSSSMTNKGLIHRNYNAYVLNIGEANEVAEWVTCYLSAGKNVLPELWKMNTHQAQVFLASYKRADGHEYRPGSWQTSSVRADHADFLQGMMVIAGMRGTVSFNPKKGNTGCYTISTTKRTEVTVDSGLWTRIPYKGTVWCVSVKNRTLVVRRRGKHLITMNTHKLIIAEPAPKLLLSDDGAKIKASYLQPARQAEPYIEPDRRWYCNTGSYMRSQMLDDDSYAELAGYDPVELGFIRVKIRDRKIVGVEKVVVG